jgi:hypothetical protein
MSALKDIIGQRFGRLVVLGREPNRRDNRTLWLARCDCGAEKVVVGHQLRSGSTTSCGCLHSEDLAERNRVNATHGLRNSPLYNTWKNMIDRCVNPKNKRWENYGGRGIAVCDRWSDSVTDFHNDILAEIGPRPAGKSIDRKDNDGNYEPGNVRWATPKEQRNNRSDIKRGKAA